MWEVVELEGNERDDDEGKEVIEVEAAPGGTLGIVEVARREGSSSIGSSFNDEVAN